MPLNWYWEKRVGLVFVFFFPFICLFVRLFVCLLVHAKPALIEPLIRNPSGYSKSTISGGGVGLGGEGSQNLGSKFEPPPTNVFVN
jgi:hypothetical protein